MKVALINTPCPHLEEDKLEPPLGLLYLATVLNARGHEATIIDLAGMNLQECKQKLSDTITSYDFAGFSSFTSSFYLTSELSKFVKSIYPSIHTMVGGPHATALPQEVLPFFDSVIVGEGENVITDIVESRKGGIIYADPIENLDTIPIPDYNLIDFRNYKRTVNGKKSASILTSRGCPFNCAFCNSIMFKKVRFRSPEHVAKEINTLYYHHNISNFRMQDDLFTMKVNRIARIFEFTPKINYRCFSRADTLTKPVCDLLRKTGCMHVSIGVESGSQEILKNMNKGINQRDIKKGIKNAKAAGLQVRIYIIVGFPGETNKTIEESIRFIRSLDFDEFAVYPLIPYPGTDLFNNAEKYGITNIDYAYDKYIQIGKNRKAGFTVRTKDFDEGQVRIWRQRMIDDLECNLNKSWSLHKSKCR